MAGSRNAEVTDSPAIFVIFMLYLNVFDSVIAGMTGSRSDEVTGGPARAVTAGQGVPGFTRACMCARARGSLLAERVSKQSLCGCVRFCVCACVFVFGLCLCLCVCVCLCDCV